MACFPCFFLYNFRQPKKGGEYGNEHSVCGRAVDLGTWNHAVCEVLQTRAYVLQKGSPDYILFCYHSIVFAHDKFRHRLLQALQAQRLVQWPDENEPDEYEPDGYATKDDGSQNARKNDEGMSDDEADDGRHAKAGRRSDADGPKEKIILLVGCDWLF
jgi:hypothetical protein